MSPAYLSVAPNNAMHQSRHQEDMICIPVFMRPGDGKRWPILVRGAPRGRLELSLRGTGFFYG